jgi:predicted nucleic acid-binding protein
MQPALFDTSIYVSALRRGDPGPAVARFVAENDMWLSAVVLEELYAGARERDRHVVEMIEGQFDKESRILLPDLDDWFPAKYCHGWRPGTTMNKLGEAGSPMTR